jgi:hypothetical protein
MSRDTDTRAQPVRVSVMLLEDGIARTSKLTDPGPRLMRRQMHDGKS